jgi:hypothetical protein
MTHRLQPVIGQTPESVACDAVADKTHRRRRAPVASQSDYQRRMVRISKSADPPYHFVEPGP